MSFAAKIGAVGGLHRRLAQQVAAAGEGGEELVVEVVAVGEDDDGRVLHRRVKDDAPCVERHRQALARPLRVPDHPDPPVAALPTRHRCGREAALRLAWLARMPADHRGAERFLDRDVDGVELVVARDLLGELAAAGVLEDDEVPQQGEEALAIEDALQHHLELGDGRPGIIVPRDRAPWLEPLLACPERTDAGLDAVGGHQDGVEGEQGRDLCLVRLELLVRAPDGGVLIGGVLELDDRERQTVDEQHDVGPARVLALGHRELVDREPVVVVWGVEVDDLRLRTSDRAVGSAVLDGDTINEHPVNGAVELDQRRRIGARQLAVGILDGVGRQVGVEANERVAQTALRGRRHGRLGRIARRRSPQARSPGRG